MKKKEHIEPPSKKDIVPATKEERIEQLSRPCGRQALGRLRLPGGRLRPHSYPPLRWKMAPKLLNFPRVRVEGDAAARGLCGTKKANNVSRFDGSATVKASSQ